MRVRVVGLLFYCNVPIFTSLRVSDDGMRVFDAVARTVHRCVFNAHSVLIIICIYV